MTDNTCDQSSSLIILYMHNDVGEMWIENVKQIIMPGVNWYKIYSRGRRLWRKIMPRFKNE